MNSDFCDLDVNEDIHLFFFKPHFSNKDLANVNVHCYYRVFYFQLDSHTFMNFIMYFYTGDLRFDSFGKVLHEEPVIENNLSLRQ